MLGAEPWHPGTGGATIRCADMLLDARASKRLLRLRDGLRYRLELINRGDATATGMRLVAGLTGTSPTS